MRNKVLDIKFKDHPRCATCSYLTEEEYCIEWSCKMKVSGYCNLHTDFEELTIWGNYGLNISRELNQLEKEWTLESDKIRDIYYKKIEVIRKQCKHIHDDGSSALVLAGKPWHDGWDECAICGTFIESNEYGTIER